MSSTETQLTWKEVEDLDEIWLNLGGRQNHHPVPEYQNYVAVDLKPIGGGWAVQHDLRTALPLADGSVSRIITEDFVEHIPADFIGQLLAEAYRVLEPGGTMRIACPDYNNPKDRFAFDGCAHDSRNEQHITRTDRFMIERLLFDSPFTEYRFLNYWDGDRFVQEDVDYSLGPVKRCPDNDPRCRRDGAQSKLRGALSDGKYAATHLRDFRLGEYRSRPGKRWHVTSVIVDIKR